jgi:Cu/Ag efflux protein CusF
MSSMRAAIRWAPWAALALLGAVAGSSCARAAEASAPAVRRYTMRAEVVRLAEKPGGYLTLRHEAVDDFTDESGAVVGMDSMVMPFPVVQDASLDGLEVGDKIEAVMAVDWEQGYCLLEGIKKLSPETVLHFGKARSAGKAPPRAHDMNDDMNPERRP